MAEGKAGLAATTAFVGIDRNLGAPVDVDGVPGPQERGTGAARRMVPDRRHETSVMLGRYIVGMR